MKYIVNAHNDSVFDALKQGISGVFAAHGKGVILRDLKHIPATLIEIADNEASISNNETLLDDIRALPQCRAIDYNCRLQLA